MKKKFIITLFIFFLGIGQFVYSQDFTSEGILFQAVAKDLQGNPAGERNIYVRVEIKENTSDGPVKYGETFEVFSDKNGIFSLIIGQGSQTSGFSGLSGLNWVESIYFLHVEIAVAPTLQGFQWNLEDEYRDIGTTQLWSVPYSFNAGISNSAITLESVLSPTLGGTGLDNSDYTIKLEGNLSFIGPANISFKTNLDTSLKSQNQKDIIITLPKGTNSNSSIELTLSSLAGEEELLNKTLVKSIISSPKFSGLIEVPYPTGQSENEAINSKFLDEELSILSSDISDLSTDIIGKLSLSGGTMTGDIEMSENKITDLATPDQPNDAATKDYVDAALTDFSVSLPESKLSLSGGTMSGTINMNNNVISNLQTPALDLDAANKGYVDSLTKLSPQIGITLPDTKIFVGTSSNTAVSVMLNGDATLTNSGTITIADNACDDQLDKENISLTGFASPTATLDMNNNVISNLQTPTLDLDAANKGYVDSQLTASLTPLATTTTSGTIVLAGALTGTATNVLLAAESVSSTTIVDGSIATIDIAASAITSSTIADNAVGDDQLDKENISLTGFASPTATLDMNNNVISNLQTPTLDLDAANKGYVDSQLTTSLTPLATTTTSGTIVLAGALTGTATNVLLAAESVSSTTIVDGSIATIDIAASAITSSTIADNAVGDDQLDKENISLTGFASPTATLDMNNNVISNLQTPTLDLDAANKGYVDSQLTTSLTPLATTTTSGTIVLAGALTGTATNVLLAAESVSSTTIVDGSIATIDIAASAITSSTIADNAVGDDQLDKENISLTGFASPTATLDMNNNVISNLQTPTLDLDAANKGYVDSQLTTSLTPLATTTTSGTIVLAGALTGTATNVLLAAESVSSTTIVDGSIATIDIAASAITSSTIADNAVGDDQLDKENISLTGFASPTATLDMNNNVISNLQTPTLDLDAANKGYVDSQLTTSLTPLATTTTSGTIVLAGALTGTATNVLLAAESVSSTTIVDGSIATIDIAASAITSSTIADNAVGDDQLDKENISLTGFASPTATLDMNNNVISNLQTPTLDLDAANKGYVDSQLTTSLTPLATTTTSGTIVLAGALTGTATNVLLAAESVSSTTIVDGSIATIDIAASAITSSTIADNAVGDDQLDKENISLTGFASPTATLDMNNNVISNLQTPTLDLDAANKGYVDSQLTTSLTPLATTTTSGTIVLAGALTGTATNVLLAAESVSSTTIVDGSIATIDIAASAITSSTIADNAVGDDQLDKENISLTGFASPTATLDMNNNVISNLQTPTLDLDAR